MERAEERQRPVQNTFLRVNKDGSIGFQLEETEPDRRAVKSVPEPGTEEFGERLREETREKYGGKWWDY